MAKACVTRAWTQRQNSGASSCAYEYHPRPYPLPWLQLWDLLRPARLEPHKTCPKERPVPQFFMAWIALRVQEARKPSMELHKTTHKASSNGFPGSMTVIVQIGHLTIISRFEWRAAGPACRLFPSLAEGKRFDEKEP